MQTAPPGVEPQFKIRAIFKWPSALNCGICPGIGELSRLAFDEMVDAAVLASARVQPKRLTQTGYSFRILRLEDALRHVLGSERTQEIFWLHCEKGF